MAVAKTPQQTDVLTLEANAAASEILVSGAGALARADSLGSSLQILIDTIAERCGMGSAAIFIVDRPGDRLEIAASFGLGEPAIAGLAAAVGHADHPIARTVATPVSSFDVQPMAPGGPALRSHLPLIVTRDGIDKVLGVLALAHDHPIDPTMRPVIQAGADLAAVAIEDRRG